MRKFGKIFLATLVVSKLVLGSSAAYITTTSTDAKAAEQVQKWGHGEGGSSGGESVNTQGITSMDAQTPWYNYEGYTSYDPTFTLDYNFVRAMKYDNVSINGYVVDPKDYKDYEYTKNINDTNIDFNDKDEPIQITFKTKPNTVTKEAFKKAHGSNMGHEELVTEDYTMVPYNTNDGSYKAFFDKNDYLTKIIIGQ
ncbi:hypothetical protein QI224_09925 [Staphylococcus saprophyticus]|uniref:immunodominant staphylococcal antigen IsaB family protein n=1 Tax=Staphylococcus saprophyticus TaxID=29385 RepID=UPI000852E73F|nr:hypothetical protein [Staphylococcus saprophyticus]MDW4347259.1 hypothetical protein [Staphylococcus saprophyticus]MDW4453136.1 hypothetical protein [Staphylococcus saprophyticus]MDW4524279.1 hypothetical protein [Staphylococcus saprophyticus]OEK43949.1 hypothetical protein ASS91_07565 [Staphylococcus saprophyticus]